MGLITYENLEDGQKVTANVFNERFAQIVAQLNGNIDENNLKDAGISKQKLQAEVFEAIYPVGSQYVNFTDNTNPATLLGFGTWQAVVGRFVVGYDSGQTEFNAAEKTGGHKKMQAHQHNSIDNAALPAWDGNILIGGSSGSEAHVSYGGSGGGYRNSRDAQNPTKTSTAGEGDGENLPPYVTAYVWKRVS